LSVTIPFWTALARFREQQGLGYPQTQVPLQEQAAVVGFHHHLLRLALSAHPGIRPRVINTDGHPAYARATEELKQSGELGQRCRCRTSPYLNNILEQDHRFIKKRINAGLGFRSVEGAWRTIEGYEAMHAIRKGQIRWLRKGDVVGQRQFIHGLFGIAA
jgi:IS6 family transposase